MLLVGPEQVGPHPRKKTIERKDEVLWAITCVVLARLRGRKKDGGPRIVDIVFKALFDLHAGRIRTRRPLRRNKKRRRSIDFRHGRNQRGHAALIPRPVEGSVCLQRNGHVGKLVAGPTVPVAAFVVVIFDEFEARVFHGVRAPDVGNITRHGKHVPQHCVHPKGGVINHAGFAPH